MKRREGKDYNHTQEETQEVKSPSGVDEPSENGRSQ
jgi:hypothetical protein